MCDLDYDGDYDWHQLVWALRKARKPHKCEACDRAIEPGDRYRYSKGLYDSSFYVQKRCLRCDMIASAMEKRGCDVNFELVDMWEVDRIEDHWDNLPDTEPVCALVFATKGEIEAMQQAREGGE